jgi:hypothetical protein
MCQSRTGQRVHWIAVQRTVCALAANTSATFLKDLLEFLRTYCRFIVSNGDSNSTEL